MNPLVHRLLGEAAPRVVHVVEDGTADAFQAIYIDGVLVVTDPRGDVMNVLQALHIEPVVALVPRGFDGKFPERLAELKTFAPRPRK